MRTISRWTLLAATAGVIPALGGAQNALTVRADNPLQIARPSETIAIPWASVRAQLPSAQPAMVRVLDALGTEVVSQVVDNDGDGQMDELIFQGDFGAGESTRHQRLSSAQIPPQRERFGLTNCKFHDS